MYRIVQVVERNGRSRQVPMTAQQADFYQRLAELRAVTDPTTTFRDVVIEQMAEACQTRSQEMRL
jgi:hypothetical protein